MSSPDIRALRRLDERAWSDAYPWLAGKARSQAMRWLGGRLNHEVEDVVAEALEDVVERISKIKDEGHLAATTVVIAHRRALDRFRRDAKQLFQREPPAELSVEHKDDTLAELVCELLRVLTPENRALLEDCYLLGMSHREIAEKRNIGVKSVGSRVGRALEQVKSAIGSNPRLSQSVYDAELSSVFVFLLLGLIK